MTHGGGKHGIDENLIGNQAGDKGASVIDMLLFFPVAPGNGIAGETGIHILINHGVPGCLGDVYGDFAPDFARA